MLSKDKFYSGETVSRLAERLQTNRKQLRQRFAEIKRSDVEGDDEQAASQENGSRFLRCSKYA